MQTLALYVDCVCVWCVPTTIVWICIECELFKRFVIILSCRHAYLWSKQWAMSMCAPSGAFERHFQFLIVVVDRRREWTPNHWQELIMLMAYPHITLLAGIFQCCSCIQWRVRHAFRPIPDICVALHFKANTFISTLTMTITNPLHSISTQFQSHLECLISETGEAQQKFKKNGSQSNFVSDESTTNKHQPFDGHGHDALPIYFRISFQSRSKSDKNQSHTRWVVVLCGARVQWHIAHSCSASFPSSKSNE